MEKIMERMLITIASIEEYYSDIQDLQDEFADILDEFEETINCPCNWRSIREELIEKYKDDRFLLDIIGEN